MQRVTCCYVQAHGVLYILRLYTVRVHLHALKAYTSVILSHVLVQASKFRVQQRLVESTTDGIEAMDSIRKICDKVDLGAKCFVYAEQFLDYEGNRVRV